MNLPGFLRHLIIEPVQLSVREKGIAALACLSAIFLTGLLSQIHAGGHTPAMLASMGASAVILFTIPGSPLAQPWPFVGGQMLSALIGVYCAFYIADMAQAAALAVGLSVLAMLGLRCLHPPGAATALAPVLNGVHQPKPDLDFLLAPVSINVLLLLMLAWLINKLVLRRDYPAKLAVPSPSNSQNALQDNLVGVSREDVDGVMRGFDHFLDIGTDELLNIFSQLQLLSFRNNVGAMNCGQIMQREIITVEYATEVEAAWMLMHEHRLKALPVLDRTHRVIGIVTHYDFLKNLKLTPYQSFQEKWLAFIKRSAEPTTDKPEAIGHIMTCKVKTLRTDSHIAELIPLVINEGHHHVPIVDEDGRFVGMVFQSRLLTAIFHQLSQHSNQLIP